jgi:hypothetical protein
MPPSLNEIKVTKGESWLEISPFIGEEIVVNNNMCFSHVHCLSLF